MKNRKLILILSLVLALTMSLGGTLAYLTDTDSEVNVMTVGNVIIDLVERQRNEDGDALEPFEQGKPLLPIVGSAQGAKDKFGLSTAANYVDKIVTVDNTGKSDAWVRVLIGFPKVLDHDEADKMPLHWNQGNNFDANGEWTAEKDVYNWTPDFVDTMTYDGIEYNVYSFTYNTVLAKGAKTPDPAIVGFYLDQRVDYDADRGVYTITYEDGNTVDLTGFDGTVKIPVLAQAVQASGFDTSDAAFTAAFPMGDDATTTLNTWFGTIKAPTLVSTAAELKDALAEGGKVMLTANIETGNIEIADGVEAVVDLNGHTLTTTLKSEGRNHYAFDNYGTLTLKGNGTIEARGVQNFGTLTVEDGVKIIATNTNGGACIWNDGGNLTINGGTFTTVEDTDDNNADPCALYSVSGNVTINGGTFEGKTNLAYAVRMDAGNMTINSANITGIHGVVGVTGGTVTIEGGNFHLVGVAGQSDHNIYAEGGNVTVNGGKFTADEAGLDAGGKIFYGSVTDNSNN